MPEVIDLSPREVLVICSRGDAWRFRTVLPTAIAGLSIAATLRATPDYVMGDALTVTADTTNPNAFYVGQSAAAFSGYFDVQISVSGSVRTYVTGELRVNQDVTR